MVKTNKKIIAGVCGVIAIKLNVNVIILRTIFILLGIAFTSITIPFYFILAIIKPKIGIEESSTNTINIKNKCGMADLPKWFIYFSYGSLYPILFWPLIAFASIFMFDNPTNFFLTFLGFIAILSYPIILFSIILLGFRLYKKNKIAILLPLIPATLGGVFLYLVFH